jgi:hypothetical protein
LVILVVGSIPDEVKKDSVAEEANIQPKWMVTHVKGARRAWCFETVL